MNAVDTNTGQRINKLGFFGKVANKILFVLKKLEKIVVGQTVPQHLFRLYFLVVIIGMLCLASPFCLQKVLVDGQLIQLNGFTNAGGKYGALQALFIACSGFSDTGLTPIPIYSYLNTFGKIVLLILIELGGIGVIALFYFVWNCFKKKQEKIDIGQLRIMQVERGGNKLSNSFRVIKVALLFMLVIQLIFMFIYAFCFCFIPAYEQQFNPHGLYPNDGISFDDKTKPLKCFGNFAYSLWVGLFTSVATLNNAGFDIISLNSLSPYRNDLGTILQFFLICELVIGGLGHFVVFDLLEKIKCKHKNQYYKLSLYTKMAVIMYVIVAGLGIIGAMAFEFSWPNNIPFNEQEYSLIGNSNSHGEFGKNPMFNRCFTIIFNSFNCRCLGMETVSTSFFAQGTKWIFSSLMFIGASPGSVAGGIRTTTLAIIFITIWCKLQGKKSVTFFKKQIKQETVVNAFIIFFLSLLLILLGMIVLWSATPSCYQYGTSEYMIECCSAFGTVGLTTGITATCSWWGLLFLVLLMFIGQLGIINTLLSWTKIHPRFNDVQYPYEEIKIG